VRCCAELEREMDVDVDVGIRIDTAVDMHPDLLASKCGEFINLS
jgi:hypothetical protein